MDSYLINIHALNFSLTNPANARKSVRLEKRQAWDNSVFHYHATRGQNAAKVSDIRIFSVRSMKGEVEHFLDGEHGFGISPSFPTVTPASENGGKMRDAQWSPNRLGYLPSRFKLNAATLVEADTVFFILPDQIMHRAALETVDAHKLDYRWMPDIDDPVAVNLMQCSAKIAADGDAKDWPLLVESIGTALAVRAMKALGARPLHGDVPYQNGLSVERLRRVIDYIDDNIYRPILLSELANIAALSPFHFSRSFRKAMNVSPVRYVWSRRVESAKRMLRDPNMALAAIAHDCGFSSQSHFTTVFKRETGVTPLRYRAGI